MDKFTSLRGVAAPLPMINVDTDAIIPKQFLKTLTRVGLGKHLFTEMRYAEDGSENPDFVLNKEPYRKHCLLNGLDDVGLTLEKAASVSAYEDRQKSEQPWLY